MVAIEAQVLGLPIVTTPVDGMKDIIEHSKNGFFAKSNDDFIDYICLLCKNNELLTNMKKYSRTRIEEFTNTDAFKKEIASFYLVDDCDRK